MLDAVSADQETVRWISADVTINGSTTIRDSELRNVRIRGGSIRIDHSTLEDVVIEADATIDRSELTRVAIRGSSELTSSELFDVSLSGQQVRAVEISAKGLVVEADRVTLAGANLVNFALVRCADALLAHSRLQASQLTACSRTLRLERGVVANSALDGAILSETTLWDSNIIGVTATTLRARGDAFVSNRFCQVAVSFMDAANVDCNECDSRASMCTAGFDTTLLAAANPSCQQFSNASGCVGP
jgi:uncharacterized protein YjbI with pentapeptide repeats